jgi:hypothetical protein
MLMQLAGSRDVGHRGMLISAINGATASQHPAARLFLEEGFAATAMGLQARTERLRPSGFGSLDPGGIGIAATAGGGARMADNDRDVMAETPQQRRNETSDREQDRSADKVQSAKREEAPNRGQDVDPDSAESDNDRDDTLSD